jgi:hypothetical protein
MGRGSKKGEIKRFHLLPPKKVRLEGSPFFTVEKTGNTQMNATWYKVYI